MRIAFIANVVAGGFDPRESDQWGGGEESLVGLARALARRGHDIVVSYDGPEYIDTLATGVRFLPRDSVQPAADLAVYFKCPELAGAPRTPRSWLWTDQERGFPHALFERIIVCSTFLQRCLSGLSPGMAPKLTVIPYCIDPDEFPDQVERHRNLVLHTASPDRGLLVLLECWPQVVASRPDATLLCTYGWERFLACGGPAALKQHVERLVGAMPSVTIARLSRREMHAAYRRAGIWAYWCEGGEFFCVAGVKAQHGGAVPIVRPWGALHETVRSGVHVQTKPALVQALIEALDPGRQDELRARMSGQQHASAIVKTWDDGAALWERVFYEPTPTPATTHLAQVPESPSGLVPNPARIAEGIFPQLVREWLGATPMEEVAAVPELHFPLPHLPRP